ncbi:GGDEF domain-containing protein [Deinococcus sp.]|uniref:GGDEF domain-containing protein n=1 Tax=Deinococcus sp. TaxID=47478 RepID=UPI002869E577|nr:GGDEF domain-containing protein [Deinococcus sp.]
MSVELPPEPPIDHTRRRGYLLIGLGAVTTFAALALMSPHGQAAPYVIGVVITLALLVATLIPQVTAARMDALLGWCSDSGAVLTIWVVAQNAGPFSAQSLLVLSIFLVVWFGVLTGRAASIRAALLVVAVASIGMLRSPAEPMPVACLAFLALLVGQMTSSGRIIRTELSEKARYASLAMTDMLTGLLNRRALHGAMNAYYAGQSRSSVRRRGGIGVLLLDLDHFKNINDNYGHDVGDSVLQHVAGVLRACAGPDDQVARWGGEEFLMLVAVPERADLEGRATQIISTLRAIHSGLPPVTVSIGIAHASEAPDVDSLLRIADRRLYRAKRSGRDRLNKDTLIHLPEHNN